MSEAVQNFNQNGTAIPQSSDATSDSPQVSSENTVEIPFATDEQLESALADAIQREKLDEEDTDSQELATPSPSRVEQEQDVDDQGAQTPADEAHYVPPNQEEYEKMVAHIEAQRKFNLRQANELGETRKQLQEFIRQKSEGLEEKFLTDPNEAIDDKIAIRQAEEAILQNELQEGVLLSKDTFLRHVTPRENLANDIAEVLLQDGIDQNFVAKFVQNPFAMATPEALIQLGKRAEMHNALKVQNAKIKELETQLAAARKQPQQVLQKLENAFKQPPTLSAKANQASTKKTISPKDIPHLSDAELNALLKEAR